MKTKNKKITYPSFEKYLANEMSNKAFEKAYKEESQCFKIAYQIAKLRKQQKLSQKELASKLDTSQSVIARIETGQQNFTTKTLQKIADAFNRTLRIEFIK